MEQGSTLYLILKNSPQAFGRAVQAAAESGSLESLQALLNTNSCSSEALEKAAKLAAKNGHLPVVEALNPPGYSATVLLVILQEAVSHNQRTVVEAFIQKKWVKEIPFNFILTPIQGGHVKMVDLLLQSPSFQNLSQIECFALFNRAALFFHMPVMQLLFKSPYFNTIASDLKSLLDKKLPLMLQLAAKEGSAGVIQKLKPSWFTQTNRRAALKTALRANQPSAVEALLAPGWTTSNITLQEMIIPLQKGFSQILQLLLNTSHSKGLSSDDFYSLLHHAIQQSQLPVLNILLQDPRFSRLKFSHIQALSSLSKNTPVRGVLLASRRGYEFSDYFLIRFIGKGLSLTRWLFAIIRQKL